MPKHKDHEEAEETPRLVFIHCGAISLDSVSARCVIIKHLVYIYILLHFLKFRPIKWSVSINSLYFELKGTKKEQ